MKTGPAQSPSPPLPQQMALPAVAVSKMACLVSASFAVPVRASPTPPSKGVHQLDSALVRLSIKATVTAAQMAHGSCTSNNHIFSVKGRCQHCLMSCGNFLYKTYSYTFNVDVDYCTEIVISGYWVGPDADDGWGFVEAVINQIT